MGFLMGFNSWEALREEMSALHGLKMDDRVTRCGATNYWCLLFLSEIM